MDQNDFDNFDIPYLISRYKKLAQNILSERTLKKGRKKYEKKMYSDNDNYYSNLINFR